jgi:menaquinone-9 beta-reductase
LYDLLVVGGGLAGATLGRALTAQGARVLIVERAQEFRDRVRGEVLLAWSVGEAERLGIVKLLLDTCGHPTRWRHGYVRGALAWRRDVVATAASPVGELNFHHPAMQRALLDAAAAAGAEIRRPAEVVAVMPGALPSAIVECGGRRERLQARLIVAADGRASRVRAWAGFAVRRDPECLALAGVLQGALDLPEDTVHMATDWARGEAVLVFPLGSGRFRSYLVHQRRGPIGPLSGARCAREFVAACVGCGAPAEWFARAETLGPLASFDAADRWVDHPHRAGIALVGDAAAANDPSFGSGMGLALRDVRVLRDALLVTDDWHAAADAYAAEHDRHYGALRTITGWMREVYYERGPAADARRARALPRIAEDPSRAPDLIGQGPDGPTDEQARRRFFGED